MLVQKGSKTDLVSIFYEIESDIYAKTTVVLFQIFIYLIILCCCLHF